MDVMVKDFLAQKRIAVAGVSRGGQSPANGILKKLKETGHTVYAINPNADMVDGEKCYASVKSTPEKPDGVVIVTPPEQTEQVVRECSEAGISRVWIHCSLVAHGTSASPAAIQFAEDHHMTVIPAGCPMMFAEPVDVFHRCMRWFMRRGGKFPR
jgi:predicted CoA-binding protein